MTKEENIATLIEHLDHWKRLLSEKICDQDEGEKTIDALQNAIKALEQEPKTGHWIAYEVRLPDRTILNYRCSVCGRKLIGYNTETLSEAPFCHCGAKMVEPQKSEDKEC